MDNKKPEQQGIDISPEIAGGIYSNLAVVSHSPSDFVMDCMSMLPGMPRPQVRSRIIMSPESAKRLAMALMENVQKYEAAFGKIDLPEAPSQPLVAPFKLPQGEA